MCTELFVELSTRTLYSFCMIKAEQFTFNFENEDMNELNLEESMWFLKEHLNSSFVRETINSFRASLNDKLDLSILCLPLVANGLKNRYVLSTLAKNNTLKSQACFDCIATAVEIANQHI